MWPRFSYQERLHMKFGKWRHETQARKPLENEKYETWFHDKKTRLHMAEVSFLIAKTAMCKRSHSRIARLSDYRSKTQQISMQEFSFLDNLYPMARVSDWRRSD